MATVRPPKPGRPPQHPVNVVRTQIWVKAVKLVAGLPSAYAVEAELRGVPKHKRAGFRPRKWEGYESGLKVPERKKGHVYEVDAAETAYPGTAKWFDSPIWRVLRGEVLDAHQVITALQQLGADVVEVLFEEDYGVPDRLRLVSIHEDHFELLVALHSFDALVAAVLLVQLSTAVGSAKLREWALLAYQELQPWIAIAPETRMNYPELFTYIDRACPHWVHVSYSARLNLHMFWHEAARHGWGKDRMPFIEARLSQLGLVQFDGQACNSDEP